MLLQEAHGLYLTVSRSAHDGIEYLLAVSLLVMLCDEIAYLENCFIFAHHLPPPFFAQDHPPLDDLIRLHTYLLPYCTFPGSDACRLASRSAMAKKAWDRN